MKVSVVMATFNGEEFLKEQLCSILGQSRKPDEIIINDDRSCDGTLRILNDLKRQSSIEINIEVNEVRLGYAQNFRKAIGRATGDIIFLSDQDDIWVNTKIEECIKVFEKNQKVLALSTGYYILNKDKPIKTRERYNKNRLKYIRWKSFIRHPKYPGMAMAFRKKIWFRIADLDWKQRAAHDWMINQYAAAQGGMFLLNNKLVFYRQHKNNTVGMLKNKKSARIRNDRTELIKELIDELETIQPTIDSVYLNKAINFQKSRIKVLEKESVILIFLHDMKNIGYISLRSIAGDIYTCIKSKWRKYA